MKYFIVMSALIFSQSAMCHFNLSPNSPSQEAVEKEVDGLVEFAFAMKDVHFIGVGGCEESTGKAYGRLSEAEKKTALIVYCLSIGTHSKDSQNALLKLFPLGSKYKDIYVDVALMGKPGLE